MPINQESLLMIPMYNSAMSFQDIERKRKHVFANVTRRKRKLLLRSKALNKSKHYNHLIWRALTLAIITCVFHFDFLFIFVCFPILNGMSDGRTDGLTDGLT